MCSLVVRSCIPICLLFLCSQVVSLAENADSVEDFIRKGDYTKAAEQLNAIGTDNIPAIVTAVYAKSDNNTDILVDFARSLRKNPCVEVISALHNEMQENGHRNPIHLIWIAENLKRKLVDSYGYGSAFEPKEQELVKRIEADIESEAFDIFKRALFANNLKKNKEVESLAYNINRLNPDLFDEIIQQVVNETFTFSTLSPDVIVENFFGNDHAALKIAGVVALFQKIDETDSWNDNLTYIMAHHLKIASSASRICRHSLTSNQTEALMNTINKLPVCARNLFIADSVCIWNRLKTEYLIASESGLKFQGSGHVFTWVPKNQPKEAEWKVTSARESALGSFRFSFQNKDEPDKWLDHNQLLVLAGPIPLSKDWYVQLDGDYCYIQSAKSKAFLYVENDDDEEKLYNGKERRVLLTEEGVPLQSDFQWQIRQCSKGEK